MTTHDQDSHLFETLHDDRPAGAFTPVDAYGASVDEDTGDAPVFTVSGGDWNDLVDEATALHEERIVVNMGPQHPSTHGVLRLILELDGETVTEAAFCLSVERLLGITDSIPERASIIRVMMMELTRINSHLVALGTGGLELGATTVMTVGFRERERILRVFEAITGLRMNNSYIRPGGVAQDVPHGAVDMVREVVDELRDGLHELELLLNENPLLRGRTVGVGYLDLTGCISLGVTGPVLRATGLPHDLRKSSPYCGYETYDFEVVTRTGCDAYDRLRIRIDEMYESLKIVLQALDRLQRTEGQPVMVEDKKIAWPAQLALGGDGLGNSLDHIREIMGTSMESLIHHFKLVTEGFRVPAGQAYQAVESPKGELGCHVVSDGGTRPYRAHFRDPSFNNLQAVAAMCEGGQVADVIVAVASIDPVMGGVDR